MNTLCIILATITLPWSLMFREEMSLGDNVVWAAMDISGFDINYKDGTRVGIWGLTPAVARNYGLRVDKWIDERYDVKRSSEAAALYMKELLKEYKNDTTRALLAFVNTPFRQVGDGRWVTPGRMRRNITKEKHQELTEAYNITDDERACRIAEADSIRNAQMMAEQAEIAQQQEIHKQIAQQTKQQDEQNARTVHVVRKGETLGHIARRYNCTVNQIKQWNNLKSDIIQIGQKLKIRK